MTKLQDLAPILRTQPRMLAHRLRGPLMWPCGPFPFQDYRVPGNPGAREKAAAASGQQQNNPAEAHSPGHSVDDNSFDMSDTTTVVGSEYDEGNYEDPNEDPRDEQEDEGSSGEGGSGGDENNEDGHEGDNDGDNSDKEDGDNDIVTEEDTRDSETEEEAGDTENEEDETPQFDSLLAAQEQRDQQFAQLAFVNAVDHRLRALQAMPRGQWQMMREPRSGILPVVGSGSTQTTNNTTEAVPPPPPSRAPEHAQYNDAEPSATRAKEPSPGPGSKRKRDEDVDVGHSSSKQRRL